MGRSTKPKRTVKTADTLFGIIEYLYEGEASVTDVAEEMDLARSTSHDHLVTLEEMGYVVKDGIKYSLSLEFLRLGMSARDDKVIYDIAKPVVERLAEETGEIVRISVMENSKAVIIGMKQGDRGVETGAAVGKGLPLHSTAAGKAMMAHLPMAEVKQIVDEYGLSAQTENTITDLETLKQELKSIRQSGIAFNNEETVKGLQGIGCSIVTDDVIHGAITIGVPANRFTESELREKMGTELKGTVNELELRLEYEE
ncbi:IclR family transcriptional regulator [Halopenitus persicus]|uniref:IclR family transcriptional regulator n=1 Tax=Halopenitus persicus TaxID=1048396 RepID=UPI000BBADB08|nr:IclR family transcriptional regulator [Halopenitus persicus]